MYTKKDLIENLKAIGVNPNGTLMVHISYKAVGETEGRAETIIDALCNYMRDGLLVLPGHTWSNVNEDNPVMDVLYTKCCVGIIPELFRKRENVIRTLHPTHSLCALGTDAEEFARGEEKMTTPCGEGGAYHKLWQRDAQILLIGLNFTRNTFIHGIEEWDKAEGTISPKKTDMYVVGYDGKRIYTPQYRHCAPLGSETFSKVEPDAVMEGVLTFGKFGDATARLMNAVPLRGLIADRIKKDKTYLLKY